MEVVEIASLSEQQYKDDRPFAQLWPGDEVRGIAGQNRLRCVCFSFELSFFFYFGMSFSDQCCVPHSSNRGMASPSLLSHSFQRSSELRERFLLAIRQADWWNFRVPNSTVVCMGRSSLRKCSLSCSCLRACGLFHRPVLWNRERLDTSRKQVQCHRCFLFARMSPKWE